MTMSRLFAVVALSAVLAACGGNEPREVDCEAGLKYQNRTAGKRVEAPEGLDQLDEFKEMPIPTAAPEAPLPPAGKCEDMPPAIRTGS